MFAAGGEEPGGLRGGPHGDRRVGAGAAPFGDEIIGPYHRSRTPAAGQGDLRGGVPVDQALSAGGVQGGAQGGVHALDRGRGQRGAIAASPTARECPVKSDQVVDVELGQRDQAESGFQVQLDVLAVGLERGGREVVAGLDPLTQPAAHRQCRPAAVGVRMAHRGQGPCRNGPRPVAAPAYPPHLARLGRARSARNTTTRDRASRHADMDRPCGGTRTARTPSHRRPSRPPPLKGGAAGALEIADDRPPATRMCRCGTHGQSLADPRQPQSYTDRLEPAIGLADPRLGRAATESLFEQVSRCNSQPVNCAANLALRE